MRGAERTYPASALAALFEAALGREKSVEVIADAARSLGLEGQAYSESEARAIVAHLATTKGLIGVVARFALSRGAVDRLVAPPPSSSRMVVEEASADGPAEVVDVLLLLAPALGDEKARDATAAAALRLGLDPSALTREQALALLDELTMSDGIVGVVARFAKARLLLST